MKYQPRAKVYKYLGLWWCCLFTNGRAGFSQFPYDSWTEAMQEAWDATQKTPTRPNEHLEEDCS